jgi:hypothetical protein
MTNYENQVEAVQQAEEVLDLLDHLAWTDVLKPKIEKQISIYGRMLPTLVLNSSKEKELGITKEELAGRMEGFKYAVAAIEEVLTKGTNAFKAINPGTLSND